MDEKNERPDGLWSVLQELSRAATAVERDDLSTLAKMHGWCESIARACGAEGTRAKAEAAALADEIAKTLAGIILDEVQDAATALRIVQQSTARLAALVGKDIDGGASAKALPTDSTTLCAGAQPPLAARNEALSAADVAARLDRIFDDVGDATLSAEVVPLVDFGSEDGVKCDSPAEKVLPASPPKEAAIETYEQQPLVIDAKELDFVKGFIEEAFEHIESVESSVLGVERSPGDIARIDDLFRPFHTIKGAAGFLNLRDINSLTHAVETLLDQARKGQRPVTPGLIDLIFDVVDVLKSQIQAVSTYLEQPTPGTVPQPPVSELIGFLRTVVAGATEPRGRNSNGGTTRLTGERLVAQGAVAPEAVQFALDRQAEGSPKPVGEILRDADLVTARQVSQAMRGAEEGGTSGRGDQSVRIDTLKLDQLVDMVGELVIAQAQVNSHGLVVTDPKLAKGVTQVTKIVRDVQEVAMAMRMLPIASTFQRMARLVRDVARKADKLVELIITGEETELDKNVIQQIGDPLVHMVRNAVDHGIEPAQDRLAAGKPQVGRINLRAFHQGGSIVIEISDDGRGMDPRKLIAKGIEKGLIRPDEELTDQQAFALIFAPGFSTAKVVTDISGRGVGMDVVRRNIEMLRGRVDIASEIGKGSAFSIRLPLTLAIIDGMIVRVGSQRFIIPTLTIEQSLRPNPGQVTTVQQRGEVLNLRGKLIPLIQVGQLFGVADRVDPREAMVVVARCDDGRPIGLVVHELLDQQQVVIKSLGVRFKGLRGISGGAILGDGRIGLIVEPSGMAAAYDDFRLPELKRADGAAVGSRALPQTEATAGEVAVRGEQNSELLELQT